MTLINCILVASTITGTKTIQTDQISIKKIKEPVTVYSCTNTGTNGLKRPLTPHGLTIHIERPLRELRLAKARGES